MASEHAEIGMGGGGGGGVSRSEFPPSFTGAKRGNGYDEYAETRPHKQSRDGRMTTRLLLIGKYCGAIVGKGGEIVKKLREKHRVQISGLNRHTEQRVLTVVGERANIISALKEIIPVAGLEAPHPASQQKCHFEINLLVHSGHIGAVIGKGGSKIREITEVSEGKIQIHQDCLPNSNERVVAIGGSTIERVVDALDIIFDTVEPLPKREEDRFYDPQDGVSGGPAAQHNAGGGGGDRGQAVPNNRGAPGRNHNVGNLMAANTNNQIGLALGGNQLVNNNQLAAAAAAYQQHMSGATPQQQLALNNSLGGLGGGLNMGAHAQNLLQNLSVGNQAAAAAGLGGLGNLQAGGMMGLGRQGLNVGGGAHGGGGGGMQGPPGYGAQLQGGMNRGQFGNQMNNQLLQHNNANNQGNFPHDHNQLDFLQVPTKTEITVTPEMCGAIIGKGGKSIKELRATTGVKIVVTGNEKGTKDDRTITITGTQQQIQTAEHMINEYVRNYRK